MQVNENSTESLDFYFDNLCPWAWITSRWIHEVMATRDVDVTWKLISLKVLNQAKLDSGEMEEPWIEALTNAQKLLRVAAVIQAEEDNETLGRYYTEVGTAVHIDGLRHTISDTEGIESFLESKGFEKRYAEAFEDTSFDETIAHQTATALKKVGGDVGTPIITLHKAEFEHSFFGPVIGSIPRGERAAELWDACRVIWSAPDFYEIKSNIRKPPIVG